MLPENEKMRKDYLDDVFLYAKQHSVHPVYIGMDGSRSKGMDSIDSDYDTRVLYVPACRDGREIHFPWLEEEKKLHQKFYTNKESELTGKPWEFIPFWEMTSFFQFLKCPKFKDCDFSSGLYKIVGWTMKTPYSWDPYGLQQKLIPLIDSVFVPQWEIGWYKEQIDIYWKSGTESILMKHYLKALHAALSILWLRDCFGVPPVDKFALMYANPHISIEFQNKLCDFMDRYRKECRLYVVSHQNGHLYESHSVLKTSRIPVFEDLIKQAASYNISEEKIDENRIDNVINRIYDIVEESVTYKDVTCKAI